VQHVANEFAFNLDVIDGEALDVGGADAILTQGVAA
jgi:hypothetical protein